MILLLSQEKKLVKQTHGDIWQLLVFYTKHGYFLVLILKHTHLDQEYTILILQIIATNLAHGMIVKLQKYLHMKMQLQVGISNRHILILGH